MFWLRTVLRSRDVYPGSWIRIFSIPDPGSTRFLDLGSASKNFSILTQKIVSKLSEILSGMFIPDPGSWFFTHPGSQIQGSKRHRITDPDPQHWLWTCVSLGGAVLPLHCWDLYGALFTAWSCRQWQVGTSLFTKSHCFCIYSWFSWSSVDGQQPQSATFTWVF